MIIEIKNILIYIILFLLIFISIALMSTIDHPYFDIYSILLIALIIVSVYLLLLNCCRENAPVILLFSFNIILFYLVRVTVLIFFPEEGRFQNILIFTSTEINNTLIYLVLSIIATFLGIIASTAMAKLYFRNSINSPNYFLIPDFMNISPKIILIYGILANLYILFLYLQFGLARYGEVPLFLGFLTWFINGDIVTLIIISFLLSKWHQFNVNDKIFSLIYCSFFIFMVTVTGGKGALYTIALSYFFYKISSTGLVAVKRVYFAYSVVFAIAAYNLYYLGDNFRYAAFYWFGTSQVSLSDIFIESSGYSSLVSAYDLISSISRRFSHFEYMVLIVNKTDSFVRSIINLSDNIKVIINFLLPGTPFPDVKYSLELFRPAFEDYSLTDILNKKYAVHGDYWPLFGTMYVLFDYFGGLIGTFLSISIAVLIWNAIINCNSKYKYYIALWYMFSLNTLMNDSFGLDHLFQKSTLYFLSTMSLIIFIKYASPNKGNGTSIHIQTNKS